MAWYAHFVRNPLLRPHWSVCHSSLRILYMCTWQKPSLRTGTHRFTSDKHKSCRALELIGAITCRVLQETWLISEFCDKGNLNRAVSGGRFHAKETGTPDLVESSILHDDISLPAKDGLG
jgi:hypothetical protein